MRPTLHVRYVAEPKHVREVTLTGTSDFGFWSDYLGPEGLAPVRGGDGAEVVVVAAEMVYLGLRFTEVSFSVRAEWVGCSDSAGMRLVHAFTSNRLFAWCERTLFGTPYDHGQGRVSVRDPVSVGLEVHGEPVLRAEMGPGERPVLRAGDTSWEGPVFLPPRGTRKEGRVFFGRLKGHAVVRPFAGGDTFRLEASAAGGMLQPLSDSGFQPREWVVRADATHGKSKTYHRADLFLPAPRVQPVPPDGGAQARRIPVWPLVPGRCPRLPTKGRTI